MKIYKTLSEAYDLGAYERLELHQWEIEELQTLLDAYGFTKAQKTVALANVYEDITYDDCAKTIYVLHQTDDGFEWKRVGYRDFITGDISILKPSRMPMLKINYNSMVKVKLDDNGKKIYANLYGEEPVLDANGFYEDILWHLMYIFGDIHAGQSFSEDGCIYMKPENVEKED